MNTLHPKYHRRAWVNTSGWTYARIGKEVLEVSAQRVSEIMCLGLATPEQVRLLRDVVGMPEDLLPTPTRGKPGPAPAGGCPASARA